MPVMMETCYKGRDSAGNSRLRDSSPPSRRSPRHVISSDKGHYKDTKDLRGAFAFLCNIVCDKVCSCKHLTVAVCVV